MTTPSRLRIERPYATLDAFLDGDAWTVDRTDMLLVGATGIGAGAAVKFEIVLTSGEPVVSGEGRALEEVAPQDGRPGGLRVRFRQLDTSSKAVLRRALDAQKRASAARPAIDAVAATARSETSPGASNDAGTAPEAAPASAGAAATETDAAPPAPEAPPAVPAPNVELPGRGEPVESGTSNVAAPERSGVRHSAPGPISAPGNRDALLERLRARTAGVVKVSAAAPSRKTAAE
jgi:hypothetical protein